MKAKVHLSLEKNFENYIKAEDIRLIEMLSRSEYIKVWKEEGKPKNSIGSVDSGFQVFIVVDGDVKAEDLKFNFNKKLEAFAKEKKQIEGKLSNKGFVQNAPSEVVEKEKTRLVDIETQSNILNSYLQDLDKIV